MRIKPWRGYGGQPAYIVVETDGIVAEVLEGDGVGGGGPLEDESINLALNFRLIHVSMETVPTAPAHRWGEPKPIVDRQAELEKKKV